MSDQPLRVRVAYFIIWSHRAKFFILDYNKRLHERYLNWGNINYADRGTEMAACKVGRSRREFGALILVDTLLCSNANSKSIVFLSDLIEVSIKHGPTNTSPNDWR
jgi:hypothetical protein